MTNELSKISGAKILYRRSEDQDWEEHWLQNRRLSCVVKNANMLVRELGEENVRIEDARGYQFQQVKHTWTRI